MSPERPSASDDERAITGVIHRLAATPVLLAAADFDGTLAEIVERPPDAIPLLEAAGALALLCNLPSTFVAVVSGRALADLQGRPGLPNGVRLVGSHGLEDAAAGPLQLTPAEQARLERVRSLAVELAAPVPGCRVEDKPAGVAYHYRSAEPAAGLAAVRAFAEALADMPDVSLRSGKAVLEASVRWASKGRALQRLRAELGAHHVLYVGDDDTDEEAFEALGEHDLGVRVGEGRTNATLRLRDPGAAATFLARLAATRRALVGREPISTVGTDASPA